MKIKIERKARKSDYTIGKVYIDGKYFCDSLEDTDRGVTQVMPFVPTGGANGYWVKPDNSHVEKVYGKTAIPTGLYDCTIQWWAKHKCYAPMLLRVGGFTGILIHNEEQCPWPARRRAYLYGRAGRKGVGLPEDRGESDRGGRLTIIFVTSRK